MESVATTPEPASEGGSARANGRHQHPANPCTSFQMPLHYPRFTRADYEAMPEWKLDSLLREYGLPTTGSLCDKRDFAMGCFLWTN
ncbi:hypothetical protein EUGRSUZ_E00074 [Eucalyptus grandis]|uniref:DUF7722 domain-containing protein n=3 Tax=Eucalyptus TaxID=3932 RepID=A0A059BZ92_EUCGR|nr:hypothetical protein EUGRSUZ_E00074 [Eucalyptus grandis]